MIDKVEEELKEIEEEQIAKKQSSRKYGTEKRFLFRKIRGL